MPMTTPPVTWLRAVFWLSTRPPPIADTTRATRRRPRSLSTWVLSIVGPEHRLSSPSGIETLSSRL